MAESSPRAARVAPLVRQELMDLIIAEVKDPRVGFVTVTDVEMTPDLRNAHVWVSVMGPDSDATLRGLSRAASFLRRALAARMALRTVPALTFHHDTGLAHAERIAALLAGDEASAPAHPPLPAPEVHRAPPPDAPPPRAGRAARHRRRR